ncbi:MAG: hypothetical protein RL139_980 [Gemmatimonadota bacterium]|jgi:hypothetical protein
MTPRLFRAPLLLAFPLALLVGACSEQLDSAATCPVLCPGQELDIVDTVLEAAVSFDTTLTGFPFLGTESPMLLASRGDTLETRVIIRFDTLPRTWAPVGDTARPITYVDSAAVLLQLLRTGVALPASSVVEVYDVTDTTAVDSIPAQLLPRFTAGNLLGSLTVDSTGFRDSLNIKVPLDTAKFHAVVADTGRPLRLGVRIRAASSVAVQVRASESGLSGPSLRFRVSPDTAVAVRAARPYSSTPRSPDGLSTEYGDYTLVARAPTTEATGRFVIGGVPGRRAYVRFNLPRWLTDSVAVLSAKLELRQDPLLALDPATRFVIRGQVVIAANALTDLSRASRLLSPVGTFISDSLRVAPGDSGVVRLEMNGAIRTWRTVNGARPVQSAIVLRPDVDGTTAAAARFYGAGAAPALRPRLRVSYVPSIRYGRP